MIAYEKALNAIIKTVTYQFNRLTTIIRLFNKNIVVELILISNINAQKLVRHFSDPVRAERDRLRETLDLISELPIKETDDYTECLLMLSDLVTEFDRFIDKLDSIK